MKMKRLVTRTLMALVLATVPAVAEDRDIIDAMLADFLSAADQRAAHETFWADDLVYTSSSGARFGKSDILAGFDAPQSDEEEADSTVYSGEEVDIRLYDDMAIVAFKLVGKPTDKAEEQDVLYFYNTGTFLKRDGVWQVVAWQATRIPPS